MREREKFGSRLGFILVSAGCAIGLGNVWKFPYICGQYGGAAFILIYLLFLALLGLPILTAEFSIGRAGRYGIAKVFDKLEPSGTGWHRFKWVGIGANFILMMFYTVVGGWMLYYTYKYISGGITELDKAGVAADFSAMLASPGTLIFWMFIALFVSSLVCIIGLEKGVEKITKGMMVLLMLLMVGLAVHSVVLKGAGEGIRFYLVPDFGKIAEAGLGNVVFAAMSQAFFTLSIGIGAMEIFGSYLSGGNTLVKESLTVIVLDTFVALMAGFIIIPACFAYGVEPDAGPSLLFITLPNLFNNMTYGRLCGAAFFIFMSFAALSTIIAVVENIIAFFMDMWNMSRKASALLVFGLLFVLSLPAALGFNVLSGVTPLGEGSGIMDLEDFLVSNNALPLGSLVFILFCTSKNGWGWDKFIKEANRGKGIKFSYKLKGYISYVLPLIITVVYLKGYYDLFKTDKSPAVFAGLDTAGICRMVFACLMLILVFGLAFKKKKK